MENKVGVVLSVLTVAVAAILIGMILFGGSIHIGSTEYKVSYELDGGVNDPDNPTSYISGKGAQLYCPYKEGYVFTGWYTDSSLINKVDYISSDDTGDKTLYAEWETSVVGQEWDYAMSGYSGNRYTGSISGTASMKFLMYAYDSGYLTETVRSYIVGSKSYEDYDLSFGSEGDDKKEWNYQTTETLTTVKGQVECYVYKAVSTSDYKTWTNYYGVEDGILYKETCLYEPAFKLLNTESIEYTLSAIQTLDSSKEYSVSAYCDVGISATGAGDHKASASVTVSETAGEDVNFKGWYSESGALLSKSRTFIVDKVYTDIKIYAMNTDDPDYVCNDLAVKYDPSVKMSADTKWTIVGDDTVICTGSSFDYTFSTAGLYNVEFVGTDLNGAKYCGTLSMVVGGQVLKTYKWEYLGEEYSVNLFIGYDDYMSYCNDTISRSSGSSAHDRTFVTYEDQYVVKLAQDLKDLNPTLSDNEYAQFVLSFVQNIEYMYDEESKGTSEYWKYPVETLYEQNGDCEDTSILYCALMKSQGYDVALLLYNGIQYRNNGHCAAGIVLEDVPAGKSYYDVGGKHYYYCETTVMGWVIGDIPEDYSSATRITVI